MLSIFYVILQRFNIGVNIINREVLKTFSKEYLNILLLIICKIVLIYYLSGPNNFIK